MKKQMMTCALMGILLLLPVQASATQTLTTVQLAQDVFIEGISENAELYIGEEIHIRGYVDDEATQKDIIWQVTGNNGIVQFNSFGNEASIIAKSPGTIWVMARATDGSERAREYGIHVKSIASGGIKPPVEEEAKPLVKEEVKPPVQEEVKPPSEEAVNEKVKDDQVLSDVILSGGSGTTLEDAIIITLRKELTAQQKITLMTKYLAELKGNFGLEFLVKRDNGNFTAYTWKIKDAENDFFIEMRVDKEDQEAYLPIIEMLDGLEKEVVQGIDRELVAEKHQNSEGHSEMTSQINGVQEGVSQDEVLQEETRAKSNQAKEIASQIDRLQEVSDEAQDRKKVKVGSILVLLSLGAALIIKSSL